MVGNDLIVLHELLSKQLDKVAMCFTTPVKVTLVVRSLTLPDGDVVLSDDEPQKIIDTVVKMYERPPTIG
jgi:hypothetical protein